jgi:aryl-alcohol dehydrogenase-like predicted oxidoreductase
LKENVKALNIDLSMADLETIDSIIKKYPNIGNRYNETLQRLVVK